MVALLSQSANPDLHEAIVHAPLVQAAVALARLQTVPQAPQLFRSFDSGVSQPFEGLPSQSPKPEPQVGEHLPPEPEATHAVEPCSFVQAAPQAPQSVVVFERLVSQPVSGRLSQSPKPELQVIEH